MQDHEVIDWILHQFRIGLARPALYPEPGTPRAWKILDMVRLFRAAPDLLQAAEAISRTAYSAEETGHTEAACIAANWDVLGPKLRAAIAKTREPKEEGVQTP